MFSRRNKTKTKDKKLSPVSASLFHRPAFIGVPAIHSIIPGTPCQYKVDKKGKHKRNEKSKASTSTPQPSKEKLPWNTANRIDVRNTPSSPSSTQLAPVPSSGQQLPLPVHKKARKECMPDWGTSSSTYEHFPEVDLDIDRAGSGYSTVTQHEAVSAGRSLADSGELRYPPSQSRQSVLKTPSISDDDEYEHIDDNISDLEVSDVVDHQRLPQIPSSGSVLEKTIKDTIIGTFSADEDTYGEINWKQKRRNKHNSGEVSVSSEELGQSRGESIKFLSNDEDDEPEFPPSSTPKPIKRSRSLSNSPKEVFRKVPHLSARSSQEMALSTLSRSQELSRESSQRLTTWSRKDEELARKQEAMAQQLAEQQQLQAKMLEKLQELEEQEQREAPAGRDASTQVIEVLKETQQKVTTPRLAMQEEAMKLLQERYDVLEQQRKEMAEMIARLQQELITVSMQPAPIADPSAGALQLRLTELKKERRLLKDTIHRLNSELSTAQAKQSTERNDINGLPEEGPTPSWMLNFKYLSPLFYAYDSRLAEQEQIIQNYEVRLEDFESRLLVILNENEQLLQERKLTGETEESVSLNQWHRLQLQCKLVLEENQILLERLQIEQEKQKKFSQAHLQEVSKLRGKVLSREKEHLEAAGHLEDYRDEIKKLKEEQFQANLKLKTNIEQADHIMVVAQLQGKLEEQKISYIQDYENMRNKLLDAEISKKGGEYEVGHLKGELQRTADDLQKSLRAQRKLRKKVQLLEKSLEDAEAGEQSASHYLSHVVKVAHRMAKERDEFASVAERQSLEKKRTLLTRNAGRSRKNEMTELLRVKKLNSENRRHSPPDKRISDSRNDFPQEKDDEIQLLRNKLGAAEKELSAEKEKSSVQHENMETLLRKAANENVELGTVVSEHSKKKIFPPEQDDSNV